MIVVDRFNEIRRSALRGTCFIAAIYVSWNLLTYATNLHLRKTLAPACIWYPVEDAGQLPYSAQYCWLKRGVFIVQVLGKSSNVIAERVYSYSDAPRFFWENNGIRYLRDEDSEFIALPPTVIERMRNALP